MKRRAATSPVDCGLRSAALAAGCGSFCEFEVAPFDPDTGKNDHFGGQNGIVVTARHNTVYRKLQNDIHSSIPRRRLSIRGLFPLFCS